MCSDVPLDQAVRSVIAASLDMDVEELPPFASQETVERWDSVSHMVVLLNLEQRFGVAFSLDQMVAMTSEERIIEVLTHLGRA